MIRLFHSLFSEEEFQHHETYLQLIVCTDIALVPVTVFEYSISIKTKHFTNLATQFI